MLWSLGLQAGVDAGLPHPARTTPSTFSLLSSASWLNASPPGRHRPLFADLARSAGAGGAPVYRRRGAAGCHANHQPSREGDRDPGRRGRAIAATVARPPLDLSRWTLPPRPALVRRLKHGRRPQLGSIDAPTIRSPCHEHRCLVPVRPGPPAPAGRATGYSRKHAGEQTMAAPLPPAAARRPGRSRLMTSTSMRCCGTATGRSSSTSGPPGAVRAGRWHRSSRPRRPSRRGAVAKVDSDACPEASARHVIRSIRRWWPSARGREIGPPQRRDTGRADRALGRGAERAGLEPVVMESAGFPARRVPIASER